MPAQKSKKSVQLQPKPAEKHVAKSETGAAAAKSVDKASVKSSSKPNPKVIAVPATKSPANHGPSATPDNKPHAVAASTPDLVVKKKPGRPPKAASADSDLTPKTGAKRGRKPKNAVKPEGDLDLSDIEAEFAEEPAATPGEKVKPLRMKISKAKERALMKEFGLDETILSEEDMAKRRLRLKALIKLGKTRGYLTHGEISDHLPDKLVDAETLEVVISMLNDMGVAVYEQTPDAETLLLNNNGPTAATEEEAEEEAEAALSTVDSEFGRTTDPVRMYMREMGTVELLTR